MRDIGSIGNVRELVVPVNYFMHVEKENIERARIFDIAEADGQEPNHNYTTTAEKDPGRRRRSSPATRSYHLALEGGDAPSLGLGAPGFTFINKLFKESIYSNL
ncbi:hypothetical protein AgCh_025216 [Apium graveolens]